MDFVSYYNTDILTHFFILYTSYFRLYPSIHQSVTIKQLVSAPEIRPGTGAKHDTSLSGQEQGGKHDTSLAVRYERRNASRMAGVLNNSAAHNKNPGRLAPPRDVRIDIRFIQFFTSCLRFRARSGSCA